MARIIVAADSLVTKLNAESFSLPFTAERLYTPKFELKDMGTLHVTVVPRGTEMELATRALERDDFEIDIGIQQRVAVSVGAEIDNLMTLVEEIADFIRGERLFGTAAWVRSSNVPIFSPEHLKENRQFTSIITVTFMELVA